MIPQKKITQETKEKKGVTIHLVHLNCAKNNRYKSALGSITFAAADR